MYKKIILLISFIFICGCSSKKQNNVGTIIEENENYIIGINYPITNTKIDTDIKEEVNKYYDSFKNKYSEKKTNKPELNIDYEFNYINNYINVALYIYINATEKEQYVKTFVYDLKQKKILSIDDITDDTDIIDYYIEINDMGQKEYSFILDNNSLTIFVQNENSFKGIDISVEDLDLKINLTSNKETKKANATLPEKVIDPNSKMVALTFDDGPSQYTEKIIEILKENDCNATFFVLGNKVSIYSDILIKSLNYGNELGNHSYNHKWLIKLNDEEILDQINKTQELIKEYTGYTPKLIRPTYGSLNDTIRNITDLDIVLWNVDTLDWKYKSSSRIVKNATKNLKDGNIILMHDTHKQTLEALPKIIQIIKEQGYECVTVSEMKEAQFIREKLNG